MKNTVDRMLAALQVDFNRMKKMFGLAQPNKTKSKGKGKAGDEDGDDAPLAGGA